MYSKVRITPKIFQDGKLTDLKAKIFRNGELKDINIEMYEEYLEPVPLWTAVTTRLLLNGQVREGRAFEVPELHRVIHTVELNNLTPDTVYNFAIPDGATTVYVTFKGDPSENMVVHWQTEIPVAPKGYTPNPNNTYKFRTLPASLNERSVTMISGGDIYQSAAQLAKMQGVFDVVANRKPDFFVIAGDIAYADNIWSKRSNWHIFWDEWFQRVVNPEDPITPLVVGIGNHEVGNGSWSIEYGGERFNFEEKKLGHNTWFAAQFAFPENGAYGVVDVGNYLSIVMLDSGHCSPLITGNDEQTLWLQDTLNARKTIPHVIPFTHVPAFPASRSYEHPWSQRVREHWTPLFESHGGIKVVFEHHDHIYKRTVPIKHVDGEPVEHPDGIIYLGDGAFGVIRDGWNPYTTWYLEDSKAYRYVQAESGETHPLDGQKGYENTIDEAWHMYETVFENDKRTIRSINVLGDGFGTVYHTLVQEVEHV